MAAVNGRGGGSGAPRRLASWWLGVVAKHTPDESRRWAEAMLRELDFIESDWAALWWATGSTGAIVRGCGREFGAWFRGGSVL